VRLLALSNILPSHLPRAYPDLDQDLRFNVGFWSRAVPLDDVELRPTLAVHF